MKFQTLVVCMGAALGSAWVQAQDPRLVQQAQHCAVLMQSLAQASAAQPDASQRWQRASDILWDVASQTQGPATDVASLKATALAQAQQKQREHADAYREDVVMCGAWAEGFLGQGAQVRYVPVYPKIVAPAVRAQYEAAARTWLPTPAPVR